MAQVTWAFTAALLGMALAAASTSAAFAAPISLKFAFFSSDRSSIFRSTIGPVVDAINADGAGLVHIDVYFSGALGHDPATQAQLVLDGTADMAFVVSGYAPELFPDDGVIELPGLFSGNLKAASLTYTELVATGALRGHDKFFTISALVGEAETVHSRVAITTLDELQGKKIRVNNAIEAATLARLGATPVGMPINEAAAALGAGQIDAAMLPASEPLIEFGMARIATNHYLLGVSAVPLMVVMNRQVFEGLPENVQAIIRKYSGVWAAEYFANYIETAGAKVMADLRADERRNVVDVAASDLDRMHAVFEAVTEDWLGGDAYREALLTKAKAADAKFESY